MRDLETMPAHIPHQFLPLSRLEAAPPSRSPVSEGAPLVSLWYFPLLIDALPYRPLWMGRSFPACAVQPIAIDAATTRCLAKVPLPPVPLPLLR